MNTPPLLHAEIRGHGPTVVLLHGFLSSSRYFKPLIDISERDHTIVALDLLGFGLSPKPRRSQYDYDDHIASINATLKHLGISEPFVLVGHSMGALIALRYSVLHEDRVSKLVLANMPVMLSPGEVKSEILQSSFLYSIGLRPSTHRLTWGVLKLLFWTRLLPRRMKRRIVENRYFLQHNATSRMRSFQKIIGNARTDIDLQVVKVKTLVLSGLEDRSIYLENLTRMMTLSPTVALENVPTGHHIPRSMPELLAKTFSKK